MTILDLITSANHNLFRNKTRTFLTILAIFIGSFTIVLNSAINAGVNDFIDRQVENIGGEGYIEIAPQAIYEQFEALRQGGVQEYSSEAKTVDTSYLDDKTLEKLRAIDGVESIIAYNNVSADYITSAETDKKYKLSINILPDNSLTTDMLTGAQVDANSDEYQIMLDEDYADALGFTADSAVGAKVTVAVPETIKCMTVTKREDCQKTATATVTGVTAPGVMGSSLAGLRANPAFYQHLYDLQSTGLPESQKLAYLATGHIDPAKEDAIREAFKEEGFSMTTVDDQVGMIHTFFDAILIVFNIFGVIALLAAAIGIINTLFMAVQERTREIGLMKALGMSKAKIFLSFSLEAILLGFWGSLVGIGVSIVVGHVGNAIAHQGFLADFPTFELVKFNPLTMLAIMAIIMLIAFIAGTAPARKAARENPIDALRYE